MAEIADFVKRHSAVAPGQVGEIVKAVQRALQRAGAELVPDGEYGEITEVAVKRFQATHAISASGRVGGRTAEALDATDKAQLAPTPPARESVLPVAKWLAFMRAISGTKEIQGARSSPLIIGWVHDIVGLYPDLKGTVGWYSDDATPWCGLATGWCVAKAGIRPPTALLGARNWAEDWSEGKRLTQPQLGAILVFSRKGGGHVGMYEGEDEVAYHVRGGNQSDMVNVSRVAKDRCIGIMWPKNVPVAGAGPIARDGAGGLSRNEA